MTSNRIPAWLSVSLPVYSIFFVSGLTGLGYEIAWTRMFAVGLGHEFASLLAVVAAFFGGFALGSLAFDRRLRRIRFPGRSYAFLEIAVGLWAALTAFLIPLANNAVHLLTGPYPSMHRHWAVAFAVPFLLLLPATAAMGATFPAMDQMFSRLRAHGRSIGGLYAANTLGAVGGTLATAFFLVPALGFRRTLFLLATLNLICAAVVLAGPARAEDKREPVHEPLRNLPTPFRLGATLFITGLLGIGYEVLAVRVLAQVIENTVYSFASLLAVYLIATALGAAAYQAVAPGGSSRRLLAWLVTALAAACLAGGFALGRADSIHSAVQRVAGLLQRHAGVPQLAFVPDLVLAAIVLFVPAFLMGSTFSHLVQAARSVHGSQNVHTPGDETRPTRLELGVGSALALNTIGAALAPALVGVIVLPVLGAKGTLIAIAASYLALIPSVRASYVLPALLPLLFIPFLPPDLFLLAPPPGGRVLAHREGVVAAVAVVADPAGQRYLKLHDHFYEGGTGRGFGERRMAHIPLLLHPRPARALFLGVGTGITCGAALDHPGLAVDAVELVPEVLELLPLFAEANHDLARHPRATLRVADARRTIRAGRAHYDVIVADLVHPARDGAGNLYTIEHFRAVKERLSEGGLFCQWLPLYQLDLETLQVIARTFIAAFPGARAYLAHFNAETPALGLVGALDSTRYPAGYYDTRVAEPTPAGTVTGTPKSTLHAALADHGLSDNFALLGCLLAGAGELKTWAGSGPLNTDDRPIVTFMTPRLIHRAGAPYLTLASLLDRFHPAAEEVLADDAHGEVSRRLARYFAARDIYLRGDIERVNGRLPAALNAYVASARTSADFRPAYAVALFFAEGLAARDPRLARSLLLALEAARPEKPEARMLLDSITGQ